MCGIRIFILTAISLIILGACSNPKNKKEISFAVAQPQVKTLPAMYIRTTDGKTMSARTLSGKKTILILFQPDCDHCQNEARQIRENIAHFNHYQVYFVTAAKTEEAKSFLVDFRFDNIKNFHFATTDVQSILNSYGPVSTPSIYIYSEQGELRAQFNGQTEIETILKVI